MKFEEFEKKADKKFAEVHGEEKLEDFKKFRRKRSLTRSRVLKILKKKGEQGAKQSELIEATGISQPAVSQLMDRLEKENVVKRVGKAGKYSNLRFILKWTPDKYMKFFDDLNRMIQLSKKSEVSISTVAEFLGAGILYAVRNLHSEEMEKFGRRWPDVSWYLFSLLLRTTEPDNWPELEKELSEIEFTAPNGKTGSPVKFFERTLEEAEKWVRSTTEERAKGKNNERKTE